MKLVDIGKVVRVSERWTKKGVFYLLVVEGVNSAWKVFVKDAIEEGERVAVFEKGDKMYVKRLEAVLSD
ncbi:MAG: hypothetical protein P3W91_001015 [Fervidobacterium sp.]|nr:hypothetical protein [Fervidobacterium sp.]